MEHIDLVYKLLGLAAAIYGLPKIVEELTSLKRVRLREEFKFIQSFLTELPSAHPFVIEKWYLAISGREDLNANEIRFLVSLKAPGQALRKYARARKYLEFSDPTESTPGRIAFRQEYPEQRRKWLKRWYITWYVFFAVCALSPVIFAPGFWDSNLQISLMFSGLFLLVFGSLAYSFLADYARILRGEELLLML